MRLEEFEQVEAQKPKVEVFRAPSPPYGMSAHFQGKNRSYICSQHAHNEEDCNVGWCDCPCHFWQDMEGQAEAMRSDI